jgi:hypothetical protein
MLLGLIPAEAKFFTCWDLKDTFFCIHLAPQSQTIFAFQWESPSTGEKGQLTWTQLQQGFKNSPIIFGTALASDLKIFSADQHGCTLPQYVDALLLAGPTQVRIVWKEFASFSPFCGRQDIRFTERNLRFARILSNTSGFTCHKDNIDWALRGNRLSVPFQPPRPINRLENF